MVDKFKHLRIVDEGQIVTCYLSNPPTHTLTAEGVIEIHKFLDIMEAKKILEFLPLLEMAMKFLSSIMK